MLTRALSFGAGISLYGDDMPKYAAKVDANQPSMVKALKEEFYHVDLTHRLGFGFTDFQTYNIRACQLIGIPFGIILTVEVKSEEAYNSKNYGLTIPEQKFHEANQGWLIIAWNADQVIEEYIRGLSVILRAGR